MNPFDGAWGWMYWNLALAIVPAALACVLFRRRARLGVVWWIGLGAFLAVLPNAPYVLTDIVHLRWDLARAGRSEVFLRYAVLLGVGMSAFVFAMWRWSRFLLARSVAYRIVFLIDVAVCALCAVGVYLGRVHRFNSWDVVRAPGAVVRATFEGLTSHLALAGMGLVFGATVLVAFLGILVLEAVAATRRGPVR